MSDEHTTPDDSPAAKPDEPQTPETPTAEPGHATATGEAHSPEPHHAVEHRLPTGGETTGHESPAGEEPSHEAVEPESAEEPEAAVVAEDVPASEIGSAEVTPTVDAVPPAEVPAEPVVEPKKKWYVVKIQSGREETIRAAIERKVKIEGLEEFFGQIAVPTEDVVEKKKVKARVKDKKTGEVETVYQEKNVTKKRKKFPGYLFAEVEFNDQILYLFRETSGVGDFVGATHHRAPNPMSDRDVKAMLTGIVDKPVGTKIKVKLDFEKGDKVRIREGAFSGMEGDVKAITEAKDATESPKVTVVVSIFGRPVDVDLDYWQVDKA